MIVYNPAAGRFPSRMLCERAAWVLRQQGWTVSLQHSLDGEHITRLAVQAAQEGLDAFFIAGGDGSINKALTGLIGSETALGVLPSGTANVWAQELGLPGLTWTRWMALEEAAHRLARARKARVDVGLCNGQPFLMWAGVGLDAFIVNRLEPRRRWEKHFAVLQYAASAVWQAAQWRGTQLRVLVDGQTLSGHFILAVVSNIHLYAGGLAQLSPSALLDDGAMDLWLFEGETLADTVMHAMDLLAGNHVVSEHVRCQSFHNLVMESETETYMQIDGEPLPPGRRVRIEVKSGILPVLIPDQTPHPLFGYRRAGDPN